MGARFSQQSEADTDDGPAYEMLLQRNPAAVEATTQEENQFRVDVFLKSGRVITMMAMVGQGLFGMLLTVKILEGQPVIFAAALAPLVGGGSFFGKNALVWYFNRPSWEQLGKKSFRQFVTDLSPLEWVWFENFRELIRLTNPAFLKRMDDWINLKGWEQNKTLDHVLGVVDMLFNLNIALVFAGLGRVSLNSLHGAGYLAHKLGWDWLNIYIFSQILIQIPFMVCAGLANLISFPNIHRLGVANIFLIIRDFLDLCETPDVNGQTISRKHCQSIAAYLVNLAQTWSTLGASKNAQLAAISRLITSEHDPMDAITAYANGRQLELTPYQLKDLSVLENLIVQVMSLLLVIACWIGFWNFTRMPWLIAEGIPNSVRIPTAELTLQGGMCYTSLALLSTALYEKARDFFRHRMFRHFKPHLPCIDKNTALKTGIKAVAICSFGATPNIFQALLAYEALWMAWFALFASFASELPPVHLIQTEQEEEKAKASAPAHYDTFQRGIRLFYKLAEGEQLEAKEITEFKSAVDTLIVSA